MNRIFLIGFMGSGKSTLGKELANRLDFTFIETDSWIEQQENKTISEIFSENGEEYFRKKEKEFLLHAQLLDECVVATGGGMPCFDNNLELMNQLGTTIWLDVEENVLLERLENEKSARPLIATSENLQEKIHELLESRKKFYAQAKHQIKNPTVEMIFEIITVSKS